jgi:uncharacterized protein (DUF2235 family)
MILPHFKGFRPCKSLISLPDQDHPAMGSHMIDPPSDAVVTQSKRIAVFLDGTWNTMNDNTNVWRLKSLLAPRSKDDLVQLPYYSTGVGTTVGTRFTGGAFGIGLNDEIIHAYEWLIEHFNPDDKLFIFGFSRGAYTARSLSGLISKCGLLIPGAALSVNQLYARYRQASAATTLRDLHDGKSSGRTDFDLEERWLLRYSQPIDIDFLGVWDTVGALGLPVGNLPIFGRADMQFLNTGIRVSNKRAFHALAIDEHREAFAPTLWTVDYDETSSEPHHRRGLSQVEQRWFVGSHGNVGGGCLNDPLAQLPLKWMMDRASESGLSFRRELEPDVIDSPPRIFDSYGEFLHGAYKLLTRGRRFYREIGAPSFPSGNSRMRESINETIDDSVFERWRAEPAYRPRNLDEWATRHGVKPETLRSTVLANDPSTALPA